ncbi:dTDP-4-dehydrorhamnose 3,5-epimerase family protein [Rhodococcus qingshengii]|uniref:dTDP-4-dehydrorhamnose 3,5-epimerase family protein n=1 Tax=Rhodococcus qingshengii TaxID=334542 RepID=UPI0036DDAAE4
MPPVRVTEMPLAGAFRLSSHQFPDRRGLFYEAFRTADVSAALGYPFVVAQAHYSISKRDVIRGIHGTQLPPGQGKLISCVRGEVLDVAVDLRPDSPTFGRCVTTHQTAANGNALLLGEGIGHAFQSLTDDATMLFLCTVEYVPGTMTVIDALDPEIGIPWDRTRRPILSEKDAAAPTLAQARDTGVLATLGQIREFRSAGPTS